MSTRPPVTEAEERGAGLTDVSRRLDSRATRGLGLQRWGLNQVRAATGSSLALDDRDFAPELGSRNLVSSTAMFPAMAATDCLAVACETARDRRESRNLHAVSTLTLCRAALESASRTLWLLKPADREARRSRCLAVTKHELQQQSFFVGLLDSNHVGPERHTNADYGGFLRHKEEFVARRAFLDTITGLEPIRFRPIVTEAADWIKENAPAGGRGDIRSRDLTHGMKIAYNVGSGTTHGMKWLNEYVGRNQALLLGVIADGLAAAVYMTECAIALFEAQANLPHSHARNSSYPDRLHSTVRLWARSYPATSPDTA